MCCRRTFFAIPIAPFATAPHCEQRLRSDCLRWTFRMLRSRWSLRWVAIAPMLARSVTTPRIFGIVGRTLPFVSSIAQLLCALLTVQRASAQGTRCHGNNGESCHIDVASCNTPVFEDGTSRGRQVVRRSIQEMQHEEYCCLDMEETYRRRSLSAGFSCDPWLLALVDQGQADFTKRDRLGYLCDAIRQERVFRESGARLGAWLRLFFAHSSQSFQDKPKSVPYHPLSGRS